MRETHLRIKSPILILILLICSLALFAGVLPGNNNQSPAFGLATEFNDLVLGIPTQLTLPLFSTATPIIETDRTGYFAGSTVLINGSGYVPGQVITLQVVHADGTAEAGGGHEAFSVTADELGAFTSTWALGRDANGHRYSLLADTVAVAEFYRIAWIEADKFDYQPGEIVQISGNGFDPNETVSLQIVHLNGDNSGNGHLPFDVTAGADGSVHATWFVNPDDSLKSLFRLTAEGRNSGLYASSAFSDAYVTLIDDNGADDYPGQKDLNFLKVDHAPSTGDLGILWGWDDTAWSGNNTGDGCALIDTDSDGHANYAFCVTVSGNPATYKAKTLYSCGDDSSDRCSMPAAPVTISHGSTAGASIPTDSDPFGVIGSPYYLASHVTGNTCSNTPGCYTKDTVADVTLFMADVGGAAYANLINVCSYPSQEPNSAPSECVVTPNNGFLTIKKTTDTPNSDSVTFNFTSTPASQADQPAASSSYSKAITGAATDIVVAQLVSYAPTTTLNLAEVVPSDWQLDSASCYIQTATPTLTGTFTSPGIDNLEIRSGLETICTFNDSLAQGSLQIVKRVVNDNGGTTGVSSFGLNTTAGTLTFDSGVADGTNILKYTSEKMTVDTGSYTLREDDITGYTEGTWSCTGATPSDTSISLGAVTVPAGKDVVCTITNDDVAPQLTLNKHVVNDNGGTANASAWTLTATGTSGGFSGAGSPATGADAANGPNNVTAGVEYTLSESGGPSGYTSNDIWVCTGGGTFTSPNKITLGVGETASCTIDNDDAAATLTLDKIVVNDNGGTAAESSWTLKATGTVGSPTNLSGPGAAGHTDVVSGTNFKADTYTLAETGTVTGYTNGTTYSCVKNGAAAVESNTITLANGDSAVCTITNNDDPPQLHLRKTITNDNGGTAAITDWTLKATGAGSDPTNLNGKTPVDSSTTAFKADTYLLAEIDGPAGYTAGAWNCGTATMPDATHVTVPLGGDVTCTINNDDNAPSLTLVKEVKNDNGGTASASDWTLTATGPTGFSGAGPTVNNGASFDAGSYDLSEAGGPSGYSASAWVCVGGTQDDGDTITLALGQSATCTITNDDIAPKLKLVKTVTKDNGGTAVPNDWHLVATGTGGFTENNPDASTATFRDVSAGIDYALSETGGPSGYEMGGFVCTGFKGFSIVNNGMPVNTVTLKPGDEITCTVNNNDIAPTLTLIKEVKNDNGGTAVVSDFPLFISGNAVTSGQANTVTANVAYVASETTSPGYAPSAWTGDCAADGSITLLPGQNKTCTITNDDIAPKLTLVKTVHNDNGGTAVVSDFPLFISGNQVTSGVSNTLAANVKYTASETTKPGYLPSVWGSDCAADGTITLQPGDDKTCTITNDDVAPKLTLIKEVKNDNGGLAVVSDFPLFISGSPMTSGVAATLSANVAYVASETNKAGYLPSGWTGDCGADGSITLKPGDEKTCVITNDDIAPKLTLIKEVQNNNGGSAVVSDFPLFVSGQLVTSGVAATLSANVAYVASETTSPGYTPSAWGGDCAADGSITLKPGDEKTCVITNDDVAPKLTLIKEVKNDNGGLAVVSDFPLFVSGTPVTSGVASTLSANVKYFASETNKTGYLPSAWSGDCAADGSITLKPGDEKICVITNDDVAPTLTLVKHVVNDNGGAKLVADFPLSISGSSVTSGQVNTVVANVAYLASETGSFGYAASAWGGDCAADGSITLSPGDNKTCEITNDDIAPQLKLVKTVTTNNGGTAVPNDWDLVATGDGGIKELTPAAADAAFHNVKAGITYTLSEENGPSGYAMGGFVCTGFQTMRSFSSLGPSNLVTLNPGDQVTCTVNNDDIAPTLTLIKTVVNDNGGLLTEANFPSFIDGNPVSWGAPNIITAGTHTASETSHFGYAASAWGGDCAPDGSVTLLPGENKTCTITNDDISPTLKLVKTVVNNNGGSLTEADFPSFIDGSPVVWGAVNNVNAGIRTASETSHAGYAASAWGGDCAPDGSVTLLPGENKTCTITNDDIAPQLRLVKQVTNDNGGNAAPNDWDLFANGSSAGFTELKPDILDSEFHDVDAGVVYTLGEQNGPTGYENGTFSCSGFTALSAPTPGNTVTLSPGQKVTCTVTNNDMAPHLTLIKHVIKDNGGDASPDDFGISVGGNTVLSGVKNAYSANTALAINETGLTGYSFVSITGNAKCPSALGGTITLDEGDDITCTITNDDIAPTLTLIKSVTNNSGGAAGPNDFGISVAGNVVTSGATNSYNANTPLAINEAGLNGYSFASITGDAKCPSVLGGTVTLNEGENVTCTIGNDDQPGTLIVKKVLITPDLSVGPEDFSFSINGASSVPFEADGQNNYTVNGGIYNVVEDAKTGYLTSYDNCSNIVVPLGGSATCTVTNVYQTGFVTSSSLCTFDVDGSRPGDQFRLLFTPDVQSGVGIYKLNASNPGQFYYNVLHYNSTGAPETVTMTIPYPFVTQGATPIHAYSSVTVNQSNGQACLTPGTELFGLQEPLITLSNFGSETFGGTETIDVTVPPGISYINIHLDYGLKRTTGYLKGSNLGCGYYDATDSGANILIPGCQSYTFSNGGTHVVESVNEFKKNPGTAGLVTMNYEPVEGATIQLWSTKMVGSAFTDQDGWYQILYKHTGKAQTYTLKYLRGGTVVGIKQIQLKANGFVQVDFP